MAEKLLDTDRLLDAYPKLNDAIDEAGEALSKATEAKSTADQTRTELNQITNNDTSALGGQLSVGADGTPYSDAQERFIQEYNDVTSKLADIAKPIALLTFDDGYAEDDLTYSILKEYGYVGSFGIITNEIYNSGKNPIEKYKQYEKDGFEVMSHSATHQSITNDISITERYKEFKSSANKLRGLGFSANGFIAPYSNISANNLTYAKDIYDYILIGGTGLNGRNDFKNKTLTRISAYAQGVQATKNLIDQAISEKKLLILYDHRVGQSGALTEAEWRDILDYLKIKTVAGEIEVHNAKNGINKYYGFNAPEKKLVRSNQSFISSLASAKWVLTDNGAGATEKLDPAYVEPVRRITVPSGAPIGTSFIFDNTYTLPAGFDTLGEKIEFSSAVSMENSQYNYFDKYIDVEFLDGSNTVLLTKTNAIYPTNTTYDLPTFEYFNGIGIPVGNIKKIKVSFRFIINTAPTVVHHIGIISANLTFPNSKFPGVSKVDEGFSARLLSSTQTTTNNTYMTVLFDDMKFNDNLSYNATTGEFTVKQTGIYQINASVRWASMVDNTRLICAVFIDGNQDNATETRGIGTLSQTMTISTMLKLNAGQKLTIRAFQDSGGSLDVSIGNYTWANVYLIAKQ